MFNPDHNFSKAAELGPIVVPRSLSPFIPFSHTFFRRQRLLGFVFRAVAATGRALFLRLGLA